MHEHVISDPVSKRRKTFAWFRPNWYPDRFNAYSEDILENSP